MKNLLQKSAIFISMTRNEKPNELYEQLRDSQILVDTTRKLIVQNKKIYKVKNGSSN